ncbi:ferredoxin [Enterococcus sp. JM4C]|uniref:ferredoxin n=1 Tax=Candidatus Enterococcus huntleyi TaxID=1857217 RepID=UPI0013799166|nr:ferredoxin [Enterococcus sp. JM4C]KAF1298093.1 ferredoxin [Enterococcus sp. JM4C]
MKNCQIIPERCIACGICELLAPAVFDYDDEGIVRFVEEPNATHQFIPEAEESAVLEAYRKCPVRAILIEK